MGSDCIQLGDRRLPCRAIVLLLSLLLSLSHSASGSGGFGDGMGGAMGGGNKKPKPKPFGADIKYLRCPVCKSAAASLFDSLAIQRAADPHKFFGDEALIDAVEGACDPNTDEGDWILKHDYVRGDDKTLKLVQHDSHGKCNRECETIQQACDDVVGAYDTDIAEALYHQKSLEELTELMCTGSELGAPCQGKQTTKKARKIDEAFEPMSEKDLEMAKMMKSMADMGLSGDIFTPDMLDGFDTDGASGESIKEAASEWAEAKEGEEEMRGHYGNGDESGGESTSSERVEAADGDAESVLPVTEWPWHLQLLTVATVVLLLAAVVWPDGEVSKADSEADKVE